METILREPDNFGDLGTTSVDDDVIPFSFSGGSAEAGRTGFKLNRSVH